MRIIWGTPGEDPRIADLKAALAISDARFVALYSTHQDLLEKYHELAVPKTPATTNGNGHTPHTERRLSVVTQAIRDEAKGDTRLAAHFAKLASDLKREGKKDEEIEQSIRGWQSTEDEGRDA